MDANQHQFFQHKIPCRNKTESEIACANRTKQDDSFSRIKRAYLTLKREVYAQRHNLRLRQRLSEFEANGEIEQQLLVVHQVACSSSPAEHPIMQQWLRDISFVLLPKTVELPGDRVAKARVKFFTNKATDDTYFTKKVNYFFDGPIELHVLGVLWLLLDGWYLDASLSDACIGMRLHERVRKQESVIQRLFRPYQTQYSNWRDGAVECAQRLLTKEKRDVCILFRGSYLVARPPARTVAHQWHGWTKDWWRLRRPYFECVISEEVLREACTAANQTSRAPSGRMNHLDTYPG